MPVRVVAVVVVVDVVDVVEEMGEGEESRERIMGGICVGFVWDCGVLLERMC